jgi:hypothetical protein
LWAGFELGRAGVAHRRVGVISWREVLWQIVSSTPEVNTVRYTESVDSQWHDQGMGSGAMKQIRFNAGPTARLRTVHACATPST